MRDRTASTTTTGSEGSGQPSPGGPLYESRGRRLLLATASHSLLPTRSEGFGGLLACVLNPRCTPRHASKFKTSLSRPPATAGHRVSMPVRRAATRVRWAGMGSQLGLGSSEGDDALKSCRHHWRDALQSVAKRFCFFYLSEIHCGPLMKKHAFYMDWITTTVARAPR